MRIRSSPIRPCPIPAALRRNVDAAMFARLHVNELEESRAAWTFLDRRVALGPGVGVGHEQANLAGDQLLPRVHRHGHPSADPDARIRGIEFFQQLGEEVRRIDHIRVGKEQKRGLAAGELIVADQAANGQTGFIPIPVAGHVQVLLAAEEADELLAGGNPVLGHMGDIDDDGLADETGKLPGKALLVQVALDGDGDPIVAHGSNPNFASIVAGCVAARRITSRTRSSSV